MGKTAVIRYQVKPEVAEENQRLIEQVFAELAQTRPEGLRYVSFRLADGVSFVHVVVTENDTDPLPQLVAFKQFQENFGDRADGKPVRNEASVIGSYRFVTP